MSQIVHRTLLLWLITKTMTSIRCFINNHSSIESWILTILSIRGLAMDVSYDAVSKLGRFYLHCKSWISKVSVSGMFHLIARRPCNFETINNPHCVWWKHNIYLDLRNYLKRRMWNILGEWEVERYVWNTRSNILELNIYIFIVKLRIFATDLFMAIKEMGKR